MTTDRGAWLCTYSGRRFYPWDPRPEDVCLEDIAHALAAICRFGGHTIEHYSVAQHSVLVSRLCEPPCALAWRPGHEAWPLWGLLHDAAEAYVGDVIRPLKHGGLSSDYRDLEDRVMAAIAEAFGLPPLAPPFLSVADQVALLAEQRDLMRMPPDFVSVNLSTVPKIEPQPARLAEFTFLERFRELTQAAGARS